jgi:uncharacterized membrane protein
MLKVKDLDGRTNHEITIILLLLCWVWVVVFIGVGMFMILALIGSFWLTPFGIWFAQQKAVFEPNDPNLQDSSYDR